MKNIYIYFIVFLLPFYVSAQSNACEDQIEPIEVIVTMGAFPDAQAWEISDLDGNNLITVDWDGYSGSAPGSQFVHNIELNRCQGYEMHFEFDFIKYNLLNPSWKLISSNLNLGNEIKTGKYLGKSNIATVDSMSLAGNTKYSFFLPCQPECQVEDVVLSDEECLGSITLNPITPQTCTQENEDCEVKQNVYLLYNGLPYIGIGPIPISNGYTFTDIPEGNHKIVYELIYCDGVITKCTTDMKIYHEITAISNDDVEKNVIIQLAQPEIDDDDNLNQNVIDDLGECFIRITPDMILKNYTNSCYDSKVSFLNGLENLPEAFGETPFENHYYDINSAYEIIIMDESGVPLTQKELIERDWNFDQFGLPISPNQTNIPIAHDIVGPNEVGKTLSFKITHLGTGSTAWGILMVEDKVAPIISCKDYEINCTHPFGLDEFYEHEEVFEPNSEEMPTIVLGIVNGISTYTWIPINVANLRKGEVIKDICIETDLSIVWGENTEIFLHPPTSLGIAPIQLSICKGCFIGENRFCSSDNIGLEQLVNLNSHDGNSSQFDFHITHIEGDSILPSLYGKTWYFQLRDNRFSDYEFEVNELKKLELKINSGFPSPTETYDCTLDSVRLKSEKIKPIPCSGSNKYSGEIIREWEAIDQSGNISECTQTVRLLAPRLDEIKIPDTFNINCSKTLLPEDLLPSITGSPTIENGNIGNFCNATVTYSDKIIYTCGYAFMIYREWTYGNLCTGQFKKETQVINIVNELGPQIKDTIIIKTDKKACVGTLKLKDLGLEGRCSGIKFVKGYYDNLVFFDFIRGDSVTNIPIEHTPKIRIIATDSCENRLDTIVSIKVLDTAAPYRVSLSNYIEMGSDSCKRFSAYQLADEYEDNCTAVDLKIRYGGDSIWQDSILLCCGNASEIGLELKAEDGFQNVNVISGNIQLSCDSIDVVSDIFENNFKLFQNTPNPFQKETSIGFFLPSKESISLNIIDISGKVIKTYSGTYGIGNHTIKVDIPLSAGVYYYQLISKSYAATKKMLVLE